MMGSVCSSIDDVGHTGQQGGCVSPTSGPDVALTSGSVAPSANNALPETSIADKGDLSSRPEANTHPHNVAAGLDKDRETGEISVGAVGTEPVAPGNDDDKQREDDSKKHTGNVSMNVDTSLTSTNKDHKLKTEVDVGDNCDSNSISAVTLSKEGSREHETNVYEGVSHTITNIDYHSSSGLGKLDDTENDSGLDGEDGDCDNMMTANGEATLTLGVGQPDEDRGKMASIGELAITKPAPDFECNAVVNGSFKPVKLSDYRGKYVVLFFYPLDFTFVCPTEIIAFSDRAEEFRATNCEVLACSTDSVYSHLAWIDTPRKQGGLGPMKIPLLADRTQEVTKKYGCLKADEGVAFRGLYIIDDKGKLRQITINDLPVGRSVEETLRLVQAFQFTDKYGEVCPAGWKPGKETMKPDPKESQKYFNQSN